MFKTSSLFFLTLCATLLIQTGCDSEYTPKPRGYFRITLPEKKYIAYDSLCPFTFEYPEYAHVEHDPYPGAEPCWLNVQFPGFGATLHLSYKEVNNNLHQLTEDNRAFVMKHTYKADEINETPFVTPMHVYGVQYDIKGNAASALQFYVTDSTRHFLRASLYFNTNPNADSIAPVLNFLSEDVHRMLETFSWK